ncbi:integrase family protein [Bradyrhizobium sp. 44]|uniref:tyrosine-type recombinase/integrase n=1 Tax=Bradyrhizobium sp. 44 TaxID=2782675 RepID=UPI001FF81CE5|nr:integrase arm-type DNA-binding domain-containing protein [Bradyrhizobium sp. 44]MCK1284062.1 integrase family protein [Bradyrhizobium sp. 44]
MTRKPLKKESAASAPGEAVARKPLNKDRAAGARGEAARYELRDEKVVGLRLVVQPSGVRTWVVRYKPAASAARRFTIGAYTEALGLDEARKIAAKVKLGVVHGDDPAAERKAIRKAAPTNTVLAAFKAYDRGHLSWGRDYVDDETKEVTPAEKDASGRPVEPKIGAETAAATRSFFVRRVLPVWGNRAVGSISRQDCVALLDGLSKFKDAHRKGKTRLSHFFGWTMDRNSTVKANPAAGIQTETADSRERILSDQELRAVWLACDQLGNFGAFVRTLILTMARRNEAARMDRAELSPTLWSCEGDRTKNGLAMDWHRTPQLNAVIDPLLKRSNSPFVFEGRHHNRPMGGFSDLKAKLDAITGDAVAHWTLHDLRRTSRSLMQRLGVPLEVRRACSNHAAGGIDGVYDRHAFDVEKAEAFQKLADQIDRIVSRQSSKVVPLTRPPNKVDARALTEAYGSA